MGFLFTQFASLKHFRQYLSGVITHHSVWVAEKTGNYIYTPIQIFGVFTKKIYVSEEISRRKKYFAELSKYSTDGKPFSHESGDYGDYEFFFQVDLRKTTLEKLLELEIASQHDSAYKVVTKRAIEKAIYRCESNDNGERVLFSHIDLGGSVEIRVNNKEGITSPIPDLFPYKEVISNILDDKCISVDNYILTERECNHFVRNILKQETALFIKEVFNLRKPR